MHVLTSVHHFTKMQFLSWVLNINGHQAIHPAGLGEEENHGEKGSSFEVVVDILVKELVISCQLLSQVGYFVIVLSSAH